MKTKISDLVYKIHYLSVTFSLSVLILFFPHGFLSSALLTSPTHTSFLLGPISLQFLRSQLKEVFSAHILCQNSYLSLPLGSKLQQGRIVYLSFKYLPDTSETQKGCAISSDTDVFILDEGTETSEYSAMLCSIFKVLGGSR